MQSHLVRRARRRTRRNAASNRGMSSDSVAAAKMAGLRYVNPRTPGIRRVRAGKGFQYVDVKGHRVRTPEVLARIRALVIPPAWTDVWICTDPNGHLQAVGLDARRRR